MTRRKVSPKPIERSTTPRAIAPASEAPRSVYAGMLERARALGIFAVVTIAPLGCMAGTVVACGGARPAQPYTATGPAGFVKPIETIAPPAASASTTPPAEDDQ